MGDTSPLRPRSAIVSRNIYSLLFCLFVCPCICTENLGYIYIMTSTSPSASTRESTQEDNRRQGDDADVVYPCLHHLESSKSFIILCALEDLVEAYDDYNHDHEDDDDDTKTFSYGLKIYPRVYGPNGIEKVHPLGKSPVLTIGPSSPPTQTTTTTTGSDIPNQQQQQQRRRQSVISEARLILQYLYETFAKPLGGNNSNNNGTGLWTPSSPEDLTRDQFFQEFANSSLLFKVDFVLVSELPSTVYPWGLGHLAGIFNYPFSRYFRKDLGGLFRYMEDGLGETNPWFGGASRGLSDFLTIFPMDMADQRGYFDGSKYPRLQTWLDRIRSLPAYKRALEKGGKYNLKTFR